MNNAWVFPGWRHRKVSGGIPHKKNTKLKSCCFAFQGHAPDHRWRGQDGAFQTLLALPQAGPQSQPGRPARAPERRPLTPQHRTKPMKPGPVLLDWIGTRLAENQEVPFFLTGLFLEVNVEGFYRWVLLKSDDQRSLRMDDNEVEGHSTRLTWVVVGQHGKNIWRISGSLGLLTGLQ